MARSAQSPLARGYLIAYNAASVGAWGWILFRLIANMLANGGDYRSNYAAFGWELTLIQTTMVLDVVHVALGLVRSSVLTTAIQIMSRIIIVWIQCQLFNAPMVVESAAFTTMILAWSVTEVVRYSYYAANLLGANLSLLTWARYTFFFILYPVGAGSEATLIYKSLPAAHAVDPKLYWFFCSLIFLYLPLFPKMYMHMIRLRRKVLSPAKATVKAGSTPLKKKKKL
ncbi:hypothetical protein H4R34_001727 [Dimargaris verticillata]|uniref:Very-long-chain (3R)-3-hydroxyacyl-CoA dehydratase n=1 Tax=Dimargaris verticillata TaxID=2761393 RepID=A0A9W8B9B3_9FUNG|nr:hypothetical protein H4R34_001727 [Dimargaris verticillata]